MLDLVIVGILALAFVASLSRWRTGSPAAVLATVLSGALLVGFAMWWYVLGPVVMG